MKVKGILLAVIVIVACSCNRKEKRLIMLEESATFFLKNNKALSTRDRYGVVVIPFNSCGTCIYGTLDLFKRNPEILDKTIVILTSYSTMKPTRIKYGKEFLEHKRIILDQQSVFPELTGVLTKPVYILFEGQEAKEYREVDSFTISDDFESLKEWIK